MAKTRRFAIDLFAGCGGLTEGLKRASFHVCGAIEIEKGAVQTYRANHPEVVVQAKDIRDVSPQGFLRSLSLKKGQLDLLAGCPPCQGFSSLRTLNGSRNIKDRRNDLVFQFLRFVDAAEPKTVMLENVPGLAFDTTDRRRAESVITARQ